MERPCVSSRLRLRNYVASQALAPTVIVILAQEISWVGLDVIGDNVVNIGRALAKQEAP
jgi:hypothetical protein